MRKDIRIIQMLPILAYGDAIGNDVLALDDALSQAGYQSEIYAEVIDKRIRRKNARLISDYRDSSNQVVIYHLSTGSVLNRKVGKLQARVVIHYHNITPPDFFKGYNAQAEQKCREGLRDAVYLKDKATFCIADSEFNRQDLIRMGYTCPIEVLPILIAFDDYKKDADQTVIKKYKASGQTNIIFTGRVAPNKKQEDLIRAFYYYHKYMNPQSMLHIVGGYDSGGWYYYKLQKYVGQLGLDQSVHFTGHIPFKQILSYYQLADLFLCMSEHEGFCVPLVEAMYFGVPIIAYDSTAVGETLGDAGLLLDSKDPRIIAEAIGYVIENGSCTEYLKGKGKERLLKYSAEQVMTQFLDIIEKQL